MSVLNKIFGWPRRNTRAAREAAAWIETVNPLRGMTVRRAIAMFDAARNGNTTDLQWLYHEIEAVDPTLMVCSERRGGVLQSLDWTVNTRSERRTKNYDQHLADEQQSFLETLYGQAEDSNLDDAVEHLSSAFFRGFSHVAPIWSADGLDVIEFDLLDAWNFVRDIATGEWYWNPAGHAYGGSSGLSVIPPDELCSVVRSRHIDYPALTIYLRTSVGERAWGQFIERYGIPPVIITMPQDIPTGQEEVYRQAAEQVAQGACGSLPNGSTVSYAVDARGTDPFSPFLKHQQRLIVLMATGGTLTSLTESGSGTLAGEAHERTWQEVWRRDGAVIATAINGSVTRLALNRAFPGRPHLAYWTLDTETPPAPAEVFDDATKALTAGYIVDQQQLEEKTGYKLSPAPAAAGPQTPPRTPPSTLFSAPAAPNAAPSTANTAEPPCKTTEPHCIFTVANNTPNDPPPDAGPLKAILEAFSADWSELAKKVAGLASLPDAERRLAAADLLSDLTGYAPSDPALTAALEELLAARFAANLKQAAATTETTP